MNVTTTTTQDQPEPAAVASIRRLGVLPAWLLAPLQAEVVAEALRQAVPELADGHTALKACKIKRMLLKDDACWVGTYTLKLDDPASGKRELSLRGTLTPPHLRSATPAAPAAPQVALGAEGWHCTLPALGLVLVPEPPEHELAAMPQLTDPDASRAMLEQGMRTTPGYHDITIEVCTPEVLSYKPGSRCTLRYHLRYPPAPADRAWPSTVIAKTYRKDSKGRNAYEGMNALWNTPLARGEVVALAEPLAYIPEHKVLVQGPVAGTQSLEDLLKAALTADTAAAYAELSGYMIRTAAGLAALHSSGVCHGELVTLDERWAELHDLSARLYAAVPDLTGAADTLQAQLEALAAATPAGAPVPTHGTFNPEQVMIDGPHIGFIDFDDFCMAEPALDVGLFLAAINDTGLNALDDQQARDPATRRARLARLAAIGEVFLAFYEKLAPLDRKRVALWQAWSCLRDTLHFWIKAKPAEPDNGLLMLLDTLQTIGVIPPADPAAATATVQQARRRLAIPAAHYAAYASALLAGAGVSLNDLAELLGEVLPLIG